MPKYIVTARIDSKEYEFKVTARSAQLAGLAVIAKYRTARILSLVPAEAKEVA